MTQDIAALKQSMLFYGGSWHAPVDGQYRPVINPATGAEIARMAWAERSDVDRAVAAAVAGQKIWREQTIIERGKILREMANIVRQNGRELAGIDAADCGNPITEMLADAEFAAAAIDLMAGLIVEMKGTSIPSGSGEVNFSIREPMGVVARIVPFNHPFMFCAGKSAAPLAAGNAVIVKAPDQAPLSGIRLAELVGHLFPDGVFNMLTGGREAGEALVAHPDIASVALIGSVPTGMSVMRGAAETLKHVVLELGGKNPLIAFPDADPDVIAKAAVDGMNFTWCGQSCGSTSRAFIHTSIYDAVVERLAASAARFVPGIPTDPATTMGAIISKTQYDRVLHYIETAHAQGAHLVYGGKRPTNPALDQGFFIEPTIFSDVTADMTIFREEIFGPVLSVIRWDDEDDMIAQVNSVPYGLTGSIWTDDLGVAHRMVKRIESGYLWVNETSRHIYGTPFGGYKMSGIGREECLEELLCFSLEKHVHINLKKRAGKSV